MHRVAALATTVGIWVRRLLVLCAALLAAMPAPAAVFTVNSTTDAVDANPGDGACADASGFCTLRAAVEEANALAGDEDIALPAGRFGLTLGSLAVDGGTWASPQALRLHGSGAAATVMDAVGRDRVITASGSLRVGSLELQGVTITGGRVADPSDVGGGGVLSFVGSLTIRDSVIVGNAAQNGAGISFLGGDWLLLDRVTVSHNQGDHSAVLIGQASDIGAFGAFALVNSTISNNTTGDGSTIFAISGNGVIANCTVADNRPSSQGSEVFAIYGANLVLSGSIVANRELEAECGLFHGVGPVSGGYNIASDGSCHLIDPTDFPNTDPLLGPLQDHGGPNDTHPLLPDSPGIDAIPVADCSYDDDGDPGTPRAPLATDQRGVARPQGTGCDIGAFEVPEPMHALPSSVAALSLAAMRRLRQRAPRGVIRAAVKSFTGAGVGEP